MNTHLAPSSRLQSAFLLVACISFSIVLLNGCTGLTDAGPDLAFSYDGFGPESVVSPLIGPKGTDTQVIAHFGSTRITPQPGKPDVRYVNTEQAMNFMRRTVRSLPHTDEGNAQHARMSATYARMYRIYSTRRNSVMAVPYAGYGRGGITRTFIMPPMPPTI